LRSQAAWKVGRSKDERSGEGGRKGRDFANRLARPGWAVGKGMGMAVGTS
jgi:hypothetical protein